MSETGMNIQKSGTKREILVIAWPLILTWVSYTFMVTVSRIFLAHYDLDALSASVPASTLSFTFICLFMGAGNYVGTLVSQYFGANQLDKSAASTWQGIYFSLGSSVAIWLLTPLGVIFLKSSNHGANVIQYEIEYFKILMLGGGLLVLNAAFSSFFSGIGRTTVVMAQSVLLAIVNVGANYAFIFGKAGFPELGIYGAGLATVVANSIEAGVYFIIFLSQPFSNRFDTRKTQWA